MNEKRDDMSHWGWDIFCILIIIAFMFFDYEHIITKSEGYTNRNYTDLFWLIGFFLGKNGVYAVLVLIGICFLFNAIIKINEITLTPLKGVWRLLWTILRLAFLCFIFFLIKYNITGGISLNKNYDIILGLSMLPLVIGIILAKTKFNLWHFFVITVYIITVYKSCFKRIIEVETFEDTKIKNRIEEIIEEIRKE